MATVQSPVLVIDDHPDVRESLEELLRGEGYAVETAENGRDALAKLYAGLQPCLIILDLMMPVMDGFAFRQEQLNHPQFAHIPIIACSAAELPHQAIAQLRVDACMQKPVDLAQMLALVNQHCLKGPAQT